MLFYQSNSIPKVTTSKQSEIETPTPVSNNAKLITTETTLTSYFAGYSTTNSIGETTFIPPSTLYIVKSVAVTDPVQTVFKDSTTNLHNFNSHGLWGVTISLTVIVTTLIFMILA